METSSPIEGITLKHLAPYLPYNVVGVIQSNIHKGWLPEGSKVKLSLENARMFIGKESTIKIRLRPLSDLTKEIEVNGERFVPIEWMNEEIPNTPGFDFIRKMDFPFKYLPSTIIEYCVMEKLIEWHFDVFGLIDRGLAININELKP